MFNPRKVAVIGAGTMGSQITALLANVGIPTFLMDVPPSELTSEELKSNLTLESPKVKNRLTQILWEKAQKLSPSPLYLPTFSNLVTIGNVEDNLSWLSDVDWIIEAIIERLDLKLNLYSKIASYARPGTLITTNTSGISIGSLAAGLPPEYRRCFFGAHFFNPPRAMRLLELIPQAETDPALVSEFSDFAERTLGKGVVCCKDSPGFISNRIGYFAIQHALWLMLEEGMNIDEVDAITGSVIGRPRSATFRLGDIVGIDVLAHIGRNLCETLEADSQKKFFTQPPFVQEMINRGWFGDKKGQGYYHRIRNQNGSEILALDHHTMEYRPRQKIDFPSLISARKFSNLAQRIRFLCKATDRAGSFAWKHLSAVLCYSADHVSEIAYDIVGLDRVLKWGFNWELGPFEIWDALSVPEAVKRMEKEGRSVPSLIAEMLSKGKTCFYPSSLRTANRQGASEQLRDLGERKGTQNLYFDFTELKYRPIPISGKNIQLSLLHDTPALLQSNMGASLLDVGDGVLCVEFHSKLNAIGPEQLEILQIAEEKLRSENWIGMVIGNQGNHFCAGANLSFFLEQIRDQNWKRLNEFLELFQRLVTSFKQLPKPVVVACHGYALGCGCEFVLAAPYVIALAETYIGLPEVLVGLIPAGGGCKEMLIRFLDKMAAGRGQKSVYNGFEYSEADYFSAVRRAWETIFSAKVSNNAFDADQLGYFHQDNTKIVFNRDWLIGEAKAPIQILVDKQSHHLMPFRNHIPAIGQKGINQIQEILHSMQKDGNITDYDFQIGMKLAYVLCGGDQSSMCLLSESDFLELERQKILSLCGEPKTKERIEWMLKTGKPLQN